MNPSQNPTQQPLQTSPEVFIPQQKPNYFKIVIFFVVLNTLFSLISYFYLKSQLQKKQFDKPQTTPTAPPNAIYLFPKPTNETTEWKIFTSTKLGLSFEYPSEYKAPEENNNYISLISPLNSEPKKGSDLQNRELKIEIYVSDAEPNETLEGLIIKKKEQSNSLGVDIKILKEEAILVDGITAVKQTWEGMGTGQTILFVNNNKEYGITKYPAVTTRDVEFNQILSTFKFTDVN